jgi:hypothetical protein
MKRLLYILSVALLFAGSQNLKGATETMRVFSAEAPDSPYALVLATGPQATFSRNGKSFKKLKKGQVLTQGAVVRSGEKTVVDIFIRGWETTIRLTPNSELAFEKLSRPAKENGPVTENVLNVKSGRIFCFLRAPLPNSKFEIQTARSRSAINTAAAGRYEIRSDGKTAYDQVRLVTENGENPAATPSDIERLVIEMDQLAALAEKATNENKGAGSQ